MPPRVLRVRARSGIVTRFDLLDSGMRRMVGRRLEPHADAPNGHAWVDTGETETVPYMREFVHALQDGALWAADEETARAAFGKDWRDHFDASFGTAPTSTAAASPAAEEKG